MRTAIIGGGAAGFFCAIQLKSMVPDMRVTIFEQSSRPLRKVEISGGGRCNCTNTFNDITDLAQAYPRGARLLKRLFRQFDNHDAMQWFEDHGVKLTIQEDQCVFPESQDSHTIINCFINQCRTLGIKIQTNHRIEVPEQLLQEYDHVVVTIGGTPSKTGCVPSLFTFNINDNNLKRLMGLVVENAIVSIPGTKFKSTGPLLLTHWGVSGPAILKLSSYAARHLAEHAYKENLAISWAGTTDNEIVRQQLEVILRNNSIKTINNIRPFALQARLWDYLLQKSELSGKRCGDLGKKNLNRLTELLTNDKYIISGRCHYKDEFVTCGGISLDSVNPQTLEDKKISNLFYAGEVLDIDGITGGFNFQAAWTTAYAVAQGIAKRYSEV